MNVADCDCTFFVRRLPESLFNLISTHYITLIITVEQSLGGQQVLLKGYLAVNEIWQSLWT